MCAVARGCVSTVTWSIAGQVETEYIFHLEDDWVFNRIPGFVQASLSILR